MVRGHCFPGFTDITDITDYCAGTGLTTREDRNITFPESPAMVMYCAISVFRISSRKLSASPESLTDYEKSAVAVQQAALLKTLRKS